MISLSITIGSSESKTNKSYTTTLDNGINSKGSIVVENDGNCNVLVTSNDVNVLYGSNK